MQNSKSQAVQPKKAEQPALENSVMKRDPGQWIAHFVLLGIGICVFVMAFGYGFFEENGEVGPGLVPGLAGGVIILATLWDMWKSYKEEKMAHPVGEAKADGEQDVLDAEDDSESQTRTGAVLAVFGVLLAAVVLTRFIGLLLSLVVMVFVLVTFVERKKWWQGLLEAGCVFLMGYVVFIVLLNVPLPSGTLGLI